MLPSPRLLHFQLCFELLPALLVKRGLEVLLVLVLLLLCAAIFVREITQMVVGSQSKVRLSFVVFLCLQLMLLIQLEVPLLLHLLCQLLFFKFLLSLALNEVHRRLDFLSEALLSLLQRLLVALLSLLSLPQTFLRLLVSVLLQLLLLLEFFLPLLLDA